MASATIVSHETASKGGSKAVIKPSAKPGVAVRKVATDDEILGLSVARESAPPENKQVQFSWDKDDGSSAATGDKSSESSQTDIANELSAALEANPELRAAWDDAAAYRKTFATPADAQAANTRLADLDRLDGLFFSRRPEDHAELARAVAALDPESFNSLASAMAQLARQNHGGAQVGATSAKARNAETANLPDSKAEQPGTGADRQLTPAQEQFFHSANGAAVEEVLHAIEAQVERLLPEEISRSARNRVVGEIYRELDATLRSNRQLAQQMRDAFRSGSLDAQHQRAIVSLVAGRARQALPAVAKRVLNEWTSTIVAANQDRRARQRAAERRVDIAGSGRTGGEGRRSTSPKDIDYSRMSDSDILNL
jgi:hypothetical protein